jgi:hypothetical protein
MDKNNSEKKYISINFLSNGGNLNTDMDNNNSSSMNKEQINLKPSLGILILQ